MNPINTGIALLAAIAGILASWPTLKHGGTYGLVMILGAIALNFIVVAEDNKLTVALVSLVVYCIASLVTRAARPAKPGDVKYRE